MDVPDEYSRSDRQELVDFGFAAGVPARVLDIGCARGYMGAYMKKRGVREVVGVELSPEYGEDARTRLDRVIIGNVETITDDACVGPFDCIVYADVLEHLVDPWALVRRHQALLAPGGTMLASIPNVRFSGVLKQLICYGKWEYTASGILDRTHLRFFTLGSARALFTQAQLDVIAIKRNIALGRRSAILHYCTFGKLADFFTMQYYVLAQKSDA